MINNTRYQLLFYGRYLCRIAYILFKINFRVLRLNEMDSKIRIARAI